MFSLHNLLMKFSFLLWFTHPWKKCVLWSLAQYQCLLAFFFHQKFSWSSKKFNFYCSLMISPIFSWFSSSCKVLSCLLRSWISTKDLLNFLELHLLRPAPLLLSFCPRLALSELWFHRWATILRHSSSIFLLALYLKSLFYLVLKILIEIGILSCHALHLNKVIIRNPLRICHCPI